VGEATERSLRQQRGFDDAPMAEMETAGESQDWPHTGRCDVASTFSRDVGYFPVDVIEIPKV